MDNTILLKEEVLKRARDYSAWNKLVESLPKTLQTLLKRSTPKNKGKLRASYHQKRYYDSKRKAAIEARKLEHRRAGILGRHLIGIDEFIFTRSKENECIKNIN